jgi:hypothetical protein
MKRYDVLFLTAPEIINYGNFVALLQKRCREIRADTVCPL